MDLYLHSAIEIRRKLKTEENFSNLQNSISIKLTLNRMTTDTF